MKMPTMYFLMVFSMKILLCASQLFSVNEEVPIGSGVGFITENIQRSNNHLEPQDGLFKFHDLKQNFIITNNTIDKEELCPYQETCIVTYDVIVNPANGNKPELLTRIQIKINDINDHSPEFPEHIGQPLVINISESSPPGSSRHKLPPAEDMDYGRNGNITYSFMPSKTSSSAMSKFALGKHVIDDVTHVLFLTVTERLDRENEDEYNLTIIAEDGGSPSRSSTLEVKVQVTDHNDNAPKFDKSYYAIDVDENRPIGDEIVILRATDADMGDNSRVKYAWSDETNRNLGNIFSIDSLSGSVKLKSKLDREEHNIFHLTAIASDHGRNSLSSHALLTVNIKDVNDNRPVITFKTINGQVTELFEIPENSKKETIFGKLIVSDKDHGNNGKISCIIQSPLFFILPTPKKVTQQTSQYFEYDLLTGVAFDRENSTSHDVIISCTDEGEPSLQTNKETKVSILDVNDNSPVFERNVYWIEVEENADIDTKIFQLKAYDADEGKNSRITYDLEPQQLKWKNMLKIDDNGNIITMKNINCEDNSQMMFIVRAFDSGEPKRIGEARLEVTVRDKDEHIPIFDKTSYEFSLTSKIPENVLLGQVRAIDEDCSTRYGKVIYRLEDTYRQNVEHLVYVDKISGEIRSRVVLDKSRTMRFSVLPGNPTGQWFSESKVDVTIKLLIEEHNKQSNGAPSFYFPNETNNSVVLMVGSGNGTAICQLKLTNSSLERAKKMIKSGNKNIFKFEILSGNENGLLIVDELTGWIRTTSMINSAIQLILNVSAYNSFNNNEYSTSVLTIQFNKQEAILSDQTQSTSTILDHSVLVAILLACSAFLIIFCVTVFVIRCHLSKRRRRPRKYNCRLETVKAASNGSLNKGIYLIPELNEGSTFKDELNSNATSTLQKFNNRFVSFNVDDDLSCHVTDSRMTCPFRDNCSLHKPFTASEFDEMSYSNERDFYNLPVFSTQTTSLYSTQKSLPDENQFKSFKPLRASPIDRPPSSSSGLRQLSPTSFFPITCSGHVTSCQGSSSLNGFNYINNNCSLKDIFGHIKTQPLSNADFKQSESQI